MSATNTSHFLLSPMPAWGHIRPFCALATRLVNEQENVIVTLIVASHLLDKTQTEVSRQFLRETSESSKAVQRIRIFSPCLSDIDGLPVPDAMRLFTDAYPAAYQTLHDAKPITCAATGKTFDAVPAPCTVILDFFALPQLHATRAVSAHSVPIMTCMAAGAAAMIRFFGPESIGGIGDFGAKVGAETARTGLSADETSHKLYTHTEGKLVQIAGLPAMYDYEFFPQQLPVGRYVHTIVRAGYSFFQECDAVVVTTSYIYEPESLGAMKQWLSDMQKDLHVLGPLLPAGLVIERQNSEEGASIEIEKFLEDMLTKYGNRSVFFVSFGTLHWPSASEYVGELIEALIAKNAPFILAYASIRAILSDQQIERIKSSGLGMLSTWTPQQSILNHPATGWFVTHGGFNSITESLGSGIPLICWPFGSDQPSAAAHLTENLNVAFELFQVRTGEGLKPLARNGLSPEGTREAVGLEIRQTIDLCRSEKGQEMRRNAEEFKVKFAKAWEEDGIARQEMRNFLHKYA